MPGLNRLSIQSKMILLLLAVSLACIGVIAWIGYTSGKASLDRAIEQRLTALRSVKTTTIQTMLDSLREEVLAISDRPSTVDGMRALRDAYRRLASAQLAPEQAADLRRFYADDFLPRLASATGSEPVADAYLPASPAAAYLHYHYLAANPHPYGQKQDLEAAADDASAYAGAHERFHKIFARVVKLYGFEDMMLVDADSLDVVCAYQKTTELGTSLEDGPYAGTQMATKARGLRGQRDRDDFRIADFEPYRPSLGRPMSLVLSPICDGPQMIGILVLQFPIDDFSRVITGNSNWAAEGFGRTGECYLVGQDRTIRSRNRFMHEDSKQFLQTLGEAGVSKETIARIERQGTTICLLPVETPSVAEAFRGRTGLMRTTDYRGVRVLSAYGPIEVDSLRWALLAEMDEEEADEPIRAFGSTVLRVASGLAVASTLLALACSYLLTQPLRTLAKAAQRLGAGDTDVRVPVTSRDEFGQLGEVFNEMSASIKEQREKLEAQVRENQELLLTILPASAVAQRREGDEKASREFADVSVLFAEVLGMEEFGDRVGEARALALLGDLVAAIDEAAEECGIEKVKTIGGSYLAVCGLSVTRPDHARRMVQFAQAMELIVAMVNRDHQAGQRLAVGINSGPVVGGVVGRRRFLYDLWGDTVLIAKRLAAGREAAIRVTTPVRERTGDAVAFKGPVRIDLEGRPPIDAWTVGA
ncbi:MAG: adenylate/guanylate cyclase domain-containing protein [Planctomycetaceae bacterium]